MRRRFLILLFLFLQAPLRAQEPDPQYVALTEAVTRLCGQKLTGGNRVEYTKSGEEYLAWLLEDIAEARESIDMEFYWFDKDSSSAVLTDTLLKKVQEGVRVRLLMDNLVVPFAPELHYERLRQGGIDIRYVHDFRRMGILKSFGRIIGLRDHRKLVVIDNRIVYTGGMNICDAAIYDWTDMEVRIEGPVAAVLHATMADEWVASGGEPFDVPLPEANTSYIHVQAFTSKREASAEALFLEAIGSAKEYFYAQTPYLSPPDPILNALKEAAGRGVDVRLMLPFACDHGFMNELTRDYFEELLEAGIGVSLYGEGYDHSKTFVSDGFLTCISTINLDKRSFHINQEVGVFIFDQDVAEEFTKRFLEQEAFCGQPKPGENVRRGIHKPYRAFLRAISPLL